LGPAGNNISEYWVSIAKVKKNDDGSQTAYFIEKLDKVSMRNFK
jgi:hypothetical protein